MLKNEFLRLFSFVIIIKKRKSKFFLEDVRKYVEKIVFLMRLGYLENLDEMVKVLK